jgi:oxygen-independent coproporphyrinogen-3 oxidase
MFGLPGQSLKAFREDLGKAVALPIAHLSCYELHLEAGTPLAVASLPGEDEVADMWEASFDDLVRAGFVHYEVSNYARPGRECRHNLGYWNDREWFGFGAGAWSHLGGLRTANAASVDGYLASRADGFPPSETDAPPDAVRAALALIMGLRLRAGTDLGPLRERFGEGLVAPLEPAIARHVEGGFLEREGDRLRLTRKGLLLANGVWADILAAAKKGAKERNGAAFPGGFLSAAATG